MRTWFLNVFLAAAVVLAGLRLLHTIEEPPPALPESGAPPAVAAVPLPQPLESPESDFAGIVNRNLFSPDRLPAPPPAAVAVKAPPPPPPPQPPPKMVLFGVVLQEGEKYAFLQEAGKGASEKPERIAEGGSISGGMVKSIEADKVVMLFDGAEHEVELREPKEGLPAPPRPTSPSQVRNPVTPGRPAVRTRPTTRRGQLPGRNPLQRRLPPDERLEEGLFGEGIEEQGGIEEQIQDLFQSGDAGDLPIPEELESLLGGEGDLLEELLRSLEGQ